MSKERTPLQTVLTALRGKEHNSLRLSKDERETILKNEDSELSDFSGDTNLAEAFYRETIKQARKEKRKLKDVLKEAA